MKVKKNMYDIGIEILCLILLIGVSIYLILNWNGIPETIFLFIISWLIYIGMTVAEQFPLIWNTGVTVTEENKERVYRVLKYLLSTTKFIGIAFWVYLTIDSLLAISISVWLIPVFLILLFGSLMYFITKLVRIK